MSIGDSDNSGDEGNGSNAGRGLAGCYSPLYNCLSTHNDIALPVVSFLQDINYKSIVAELDDIQQSMLSKITDGKRSMEALLSDITQVCFQLHPDSGEMELVECRELQVKHAKQIQTAWEALARLDTNVKLKHLHSRICTATSLISLVNIVSVPLATLWQTALELY